VVKSVGVQGKTVVVTGSADNIGKGIAQRFAEEGANVVVNARSNVAVGESVAKQINDAGGKAIFVQSDASKPQEAQRLIDKAVEKFGGVDILINNAGGYEHAPFVESTLEHWQRMFDSNLYTAVNCCLSVAKIMKPGSRIVNMASIRGIDRGGCPGGAAYSAAKSAIISFTKTLAQELAPNITVNAVAPGFTQSTAFDGAPQELLDSFIGSTLLKKWLTPRDVADAFFFLANADGITGEVLVIDAGWNAH
jgi:3-oxoacyl-[acyl-carrier protein] reductase